jgi:hypothetical protein
MCYYKLATLKIVFMWVFIILYHFLFLYYTPGMALKPTQLYATEYVPPSDGERIQSPKRRVSNKRRDDR